MRHIFDEVDQGIDPLVDSLEERRPSWTPNELDRDW